jgi:hypothetical protein
MVSNGREHTKREVIEEAIEWLGYKILYTYTTERTIIPMNKYVLDDRYSSPVIRFKAAC